MSPARNVRVDITDLDADFGPMLVQRVHTDNNGFYAYTFDPINEVPPSHDIQVEVFAQDDDVARIEFPGFGVHSLIEIARDVDYGEAVDIDIEAPNDTFFGQAFAIHDALWSAHQFAEIIGDGEEDLVPVQFPTGDDDHAAVSGGTMVIGAFEWSAWEVLNHEYGHWYDRDHDVSGLVGGSHCAVPLAAVPAPCDPNDPYNYDKDKGTQLAWSEGFATFFAQAAAHHAPVPSTLSAQQRGFLTNSEYDDVITEDDGTVRNSVNFNVGRGSGDAEDDESSVAGVLRGVLDDEGPDYTMTLVKDSDALRLDDFLDYVWADDGATLISDTEDLGCSLTSSDIAPDVNLSLLSDPLDPPTVTWDRGNAGAPRERPFRRRRLRPWLHLPALHLRGDHRNVVDPERSRVGPDDREPHRDRAEGHGLAGRRPGRPWPFRGCREQRTIQAASAPLDTDGCRDITLPANDDGSTGASTLPSRSTSSARPTRTLFVNNNGNVTFDAPLSTFTPFAARRGTPPIIAPFFADVDTRGDGSAPGDLLVRRDHFDGRAGLLRQLARRRLLHSARRQAQQLPAAARRPLRHRARRLRHRLQLRQHPVGDR